MTIKNRKEQEAPSSTIVGRDETSPSSTSQNRRESDQPAASPINVKPVLKSNTKRRIAETLGLPIEDFND